MIWVWKHDVARQEDITHTVVSAGQRATDGGGGGSGVDGLRLTNGCRKAPKTYVSWDFLHISLVQLA